MACLRPAEAEPEQLGPLDAALEGVRTAVAKRAPCRQSLEVRRLPGNGREFGGRPLVILVSLWLLGRFAMATVGAVPFWMTAAAELALLPGLLVLVAPPVAEYIGKYGLYQRGA